MPKAKFVFQAQLKSDILEETIDRWGNYADQPRCREEL